VQFVGVALSLLPLLSLLPCKEERRRSCIVVFVVMLLQASIAA
jgi:hypothetical protein